MPGNEPDFLSVDQVAERLGLRVRTVRAYLRSRRLKGVRIGKQYRIAREDLDTLTGRSGAFEPVTRTPREDSEYLGFTCLTTRGGVTSGPRS